MRFPVSFWSYFKDVFLLHLKEGKQQQMTGSKAIGDEDDEMNEEHSDYDDAELVDDDDEHHRFHHDEAK